MMSRRSNWRSMPETAPILFVDDEASMRHAVTQWLGLAGFDTLVHDKAVTALNKLSTDFPGVLVTDLKMEGMDGMELLRRSQQIDPELPVVVITGHGDVETAVEAMRLGAYDFIEKPFAPERLLEIVRHASEKRQLVLENRRLRQAVNQQTLASRIIGNSRAAETLRSTVAELAGTDVSVILCGETGTGKDLIARCLHDFGRRSKGQYVAVNCAAIPETMVESEFFGHEAGAFTSAMKARVGKIEHASGGTLFLDEIDSMPLSGQGKLLRALNDRITQHAIQADGRQQEGHDAKEAGYQSQQPIPDQEVVDQCGLQHHTTYVDRAIRPEDFLAGEDLSATPEPCRFDALVGVVEPLGSEALLAISAAGTDMQLRLTGRAFPTAGATLRFAIDPTHLHVFDAASGRALRKYE